MTFSEDLDLFLADFGVPVNAGLVSGTGILDMPGQVIADGMVLTTDYRLRVRSDTFGWLKFDDVLTVNGHAYTVREAMPVEDGRFTDVLLARVEGDETVTLILDGDWL